MRARNQDDWLESLLWTWGGACERIAEMQGNAGAILAAEWASQPDRKPSEPAEPSAENYANHTQANAAALSSGAYQQLYTLHIAIRQLNRLWREMVRLRYQNRLPWEDIEGRLNVDERSRKVCMTLIKRELRVDLECSARRAVV